MNDSKNKKNAGGLKDKSTRRSATPFMAKKEPRKASKIFILN